MELSYSCNTIKAIRTGVYNQMRDGGYILNMGIGAACDGGARGVDGGGL